MTEEETIQRIREEIIMRINKRRLSKQTYNELSSLLHFLNALEQG